ncbi:hypothetical protein C922_04402 [Plasmodium inui San Antonio 1]|uniref:Uncharacterized protein n=1 Tax=Plasmodium inui San Antonio 1 TaxID=1237626 RepID=W7A1N3_9APIC|nr:hypothetical protein C922_04402 [Plasmodium inui San Antonio 1]EUD65273.1 hypothetical protein C922_04402 [Plasmodium inui San Antonio 1]
MEAEEVNFQSVELGSPTREHNPSCDAHKKKHNRKRKKKVSNSRFVNLRDWTSKVQKRYEQKLKTSEQGMNLGRKISLPNGKPECNYPSSSYSSSFKSRSSLGNNINFSSDESNYDSDIEQRICRFLKLENSETVRKKKKKRKENATEGEVVDGVADGGVGVDVSLGEHPDVTADVTPNVIGDVAANVTANSPSDVGVNSRAMNDATINTIGGATDLGDTMLGDDHSMNPVNKDTQKEKRESEDAQAGQERPIQTNDKQVSSNTMEKKKEHTEECKKNRKSNDKMVNADNVNISSKEGSAPNEDDIPENDRRGEHLTPRRNIKGEAVNGERSLKRKNGVSAEEANKQIIVEDKNPVQERDAPAPVKKGATGKEKQQKKQEEEGNKKDEKEEKREKDEKCPKEPQSESTPTSAREEPPKENDSREGPESKRERQPKEQTKQNREEGDIKEERSPRKTEEKQQIQRKENPHRPRADRGKKKNHPNEWENLSKGNPDKNGSDSHQKRNAKGKESNKSKKSMSPSREGQAKEADRSSSRKKEQPPAQIQKDVTTNQRSAKNGEEKKKKDNSHPSGKGSIQNGETMHPDRERDSNNKEEGEKLNRRDRQGESEGEGNSERGRRRNRRRDRNRGRPREAEWNRPREEEWDRPREAEWDRPREAEWVRPREAERDRSREAERDRSREAERNRSREAEWNRPREAGRDRSREAGRDRQNLRERDRERERERDRNWEAERERERDRNWGGEPEKQTGRHRGEEGERKRDRSWEAERDRERESDRDWNRQADRDWNRESERGWNRDNHFENGKKMTRMPKRNDASHVILEKKLNGVHPNVSRKRPFSNENEGNANHVPKKIHDQSDQHMHTERERYVYNSADTPSRKYSVQKNKTNDRENWEKKMSKLKEKLIRKNMNK